MAVYPQYNVPMQQFSGMQPQYPGFGMQNYMQQAQQMLPQAQTAPQSVLNRVTGVEGARAFPVAPGSVVPLFDDTRDVFYIKTTDSGGFPTIKAYAFMPLEENAQTPAPNAMTRGEIEQIVREEMQKYGQQLIQPANPSPGGTAPAE